MVNSPIPRHFFQRPKLRPTAARLACLGAALALSSCSPPPIEITTRTAGDKIIAELSQDWGLFLSDRRAPCIKEAALYARNADTSSSGWNAGAVWMIRVEAGMWCRDIGAFAIGTAPEGFEQVIAFPPGAGEYKLIAQGDNRGEATLVIGP